MRKNNNILTPSADALDAGDPLRWRDLERRFRALQSDRTDGLRAGWGFCGRDWHLFYDALSPSVLRRFDQAAACAAEIKGFYRGMSARDSWLERLKRETNAYHSGAESTVTKKGKKYRGSDGYIERVCEVSADYCEKLADDSDTQSKDRVYPTSHARIEDHPIAADAQGDLSKPSVSPPTIVKLTPREENILNVIQRMSKGCQYCRELDGACIKIQKVGIWKGAPPTYTAAYDAGKPWRHRIEDEKSKIKKKAKLAKLAEKLASE